MNDSLEFLKSFLRFDSISTDGEHTESLANCLNFLKTAFRQRGLQTEAIQVGQGTPYLIARYRPSTTQDVPHTMVYGHYDVQPVDPLDLWKTPPFEPNVQDNKIFARGACDNKGPLTALMFGFFKALEANPDLPLAVTFLIEGEEETGSPSFKEFLNTRKDVFDGVDYVLIADTVSPDLNNMVVTTAARGILTMEVRFSGPCHDLHSGLFGGAVLNPVQALSKLVASLYDDQGRVNIPGFYDDVAQPEAWERHELEKSTTTDEQLIKDSGVPALFSIPGFTPLEGTCLAPTLEINGMGGGYQGQGSKTIIPAEALVKISCRLVANQSAEKIQKLVADTIRSRIPDQVHFEIITSDTADPYLVLPGHKSNQPQQNQHLVAAFQQVEQQVESEFGKKPLFLRGGGSLPLLADLKKATGLDSFSIGLATPDNLPHAPNEFFYLEALEKGVNLFGKLFAQLATTKGVSSQYRSDDLSSTRA